MRRNRSPLREGHNNLQIEWIDCVILVAISKIKEDEKEYVSGIEVNGYNF